MGRDSITRIHSVSSYRDIAYLLPIVRDDRPAREREREPFLMRDAVRAAFVRVIERFIEFL